MQENNSLMLKFESKPQTYAINAAMCMNGGIIASYSYSYISLLATAITGSYIKIFSSLFEHFYSYALSYLAICITFIAGIFLTIFIKHKIKNPKLQSRISLIIMIASYIVLIVLDKFTSLSRSTGSDVLYFLLPIVLASSVQYNTFGFMDGVQVATMFVTNNFRQVCVRLTRGRIEKNDKETKLGLLYLFGIIFFTFGLLLGFGLFKILGVYLFVLSAILCVVCIFL